MDIKRYLRFPRAPFAFALAAGLGLVLGGVLMAELLRLAACPLCIIQRMLYLLLALAAAAGLAAAERPAARRLVLVLRVWRLQVSGSRAERPQERCPGARSWPALAELRSSRRPTA